jgi:Na+-driven multidrug efflux pump
MKHAFRFKVIFALAAFTIYGSFCMSIPHNMIGMMTNGNGAQAHIIKIGGGYLRLAVISLLPFALSTVIGSCLRETGKPKIPLFISAAATIVNTIGNWFLIYGNLGAPRLEVTGAAISTIIARSVEVAAYLIYAYKAKPDFFVPFAKIFKIDVKLIFTILQKSGMLFLSELSWISSETIMTAMYNGRGGAETVAGMAAGFTICNLFYLAFGGVWTATNVIIGSSLGAGKLTEARERGRWILYGSIILGAIVAVIGSAGATVIIPVVFSNLTENARIISSSLVYIVAIYMPLWTLLNAFFAITRAGGDTAAGMWADLVVNTFMYAPGAILLALFTTLSPVLMFALLKITDIPKFIIVHHFYKKGRWVKNLTNV